MPAQNTRLLNVGRITGLSAYEIAVKHGFEGTEEEWLESLKPASSEEVAQLENKVDKIADTAVIKPSVATMGNIAVFDAHKNVIDGGIKFSLVEGCLRVTYDDGTPTMQ